MSIEWSISRRLIVVISFPSSQYVFVLHCCKLAFIFDVQLCEWLKVWNVLSYDWVNSSVSVLFIYTSQERILLVTRDPETKVLKKAATWSQNSGVRYLAIKLNKFSSMI